MMSALEKKEKPEGKKATEKRDASPKSDVDVDAELQKLDAFRDLTVVERREIAAVSTLVTLAQDRVLPRADDGAEVPAYYFLSKGQVAFAEFERGQVPPPPSPKKRPPPVMQLTKKNIALFDPGDFFANDHVPDVRGSDGRKYDVALYTCLPVVLIKIQKADLDQILARVPTARAAIEKRAESSYYRQSFLKLENRQEILDFFVREGLEYAKAVKVIQTDKCIDCDECVMACEQRHGISRIERFGPSLGLIQFTLNCRTCEDARCIPECNFDAIELEPEHHEVIVYDNCVGCTKCAKACPHEAIRMVDVVAEEIDIVDKVKAARDDRPKTVIAKGEEKPKEKKKPKRIANKCDHCVGYEDMACITACPTGAIIQINPNELFRRDGGQADQVSKYFDPKPFEVGYSQVAAAQGVTFMRTLFALAALAVLGCAWEFGARKLSPGLSIYKPLVALLAGADAAAKLTLKYTAGFGMGRWMGYIGGGMMIVSALYTLRLHVPGLRRIGGSRTWFDFHVVFGLAGPALALLHTNLHVLSWYWVVWLWWAVVVVLLSGVVGRYLYTALPKAEFAANRAKTRLDEGIQKAADQWSSMTMSANVLQQFLKAQEKNEEVREEDDMGAIGFLGYLVSTELKSISAAISLRFGLLGEMKDTKLRKTAIELMGQRAKIERRVRFLGAVRKLLAKWRAFHIAVSVVMFVMLVAHVAISIWAVGL
ncbi:MAG: 4Fe-4S dicluster domain-containing protein [Deltaproteobacteria bacterium]|nr:4Fe-4S dicluster domain-containing protein [Deltaproteobacteria bacterium]